MVTEPAKIKGEIEDPKIEVERIMHYAMKRLYQFVPPSEVSNYCVLCRVKAKKANKNIQQRPLFDLCWTS